MKEASFYNALNIKFGTNRKKLRELKNKFITWENAWRKNFSKNDPNPEKEQEKLSNSGVQLILESDPAYPKLLRETPDPPLGIYCLGNLPKNSSVSISIVGTRKATPQGKELARTFAAALAKNGIQIVSGLAIGIDSESHKGAVEAGGKTVAVLASNPKNIYPKTNESLARKILEKGGVILSEYPLNSETLPYRFLERNRIISGLSIASLIIEAPNRSGSLATANFAIEQNRDVFVVPGFPSHPNYKGSNKLIRAGAELVTSAEEILETLGIAPDSENLARLEANSPQEEKILAVLEKSEKPVSIDKIIELTKLEARVANQTLSFLDIKNLISETEDGYTLKN